MAFTKYQDRLADALTILRDDLIPGAEADVENSDENAADNQAYHARQRLHALEEAERWLEKAWK